MYKRIVLLALIGVVSNVAFAAGREGQANVFSENYSSLCVKHAGNFEALRDQFKRSAKLSPEKASTFLSGKAGDAWSVEASSKGAVVLAIPDDKSTCALHVQGVDAKSAQKQFTQLVGKAPYPLLAKRVRGESAREASKGGVQTVSYQWSAPNSTKKMVFTLTTNTSEKTSSQAQGSVQVLPY
jgi:hypothetical protein